MGKYSLENYEIYKTKKIRPVLLSTPQDNYGRGQINYITCSWAELEPHRGCYRFAALLEEVLVTFNPVLILKPDYPDWVKDYQEECFTRFIRRAGSYFEKNNSSLIGTVITTINNKIVEWDAYLEGFRNFTLFADLHNYELISFLKNRKQEFGIRISCSEDNWIKCCEDLAGQFLQNHWERKPVLLHVLDETLGQETQRQALQWHAGFSNKKLNLGFHIALRRLTYTEKVSSGGVLPARFWFVNTGSSPCYSDLKIKLKLIREDEIHLINVSSAPSDWPVGDIIQNEIIQLPSLEEGNYSLSVGIFHKNDLPVSMGIDGKQNDGFYKMGDIRIDYVNRDNLKNVWENYYPEGYYPLEDPKRPEVQ
ncbi:DUF4832 domain-containing protein [Anaerocolumna sp. MB42-C2]|uniref:DUF4832 domain-containing protein n=1 Tax=Anaerocolumna sp. MB42-C2 TaxID=3070997 RepID=UPI0027E16C00|nr:DUF4832 domain-containing protein [Anaerocolumna sp. MB42-C2]WMJ87005.1 DUF4832 domain-containing protein [Anaerocolumna sp. MB42-C2]